MTDDPIRTERFRQIYTAQYDDLWKYCLRRTATAVEAEDVLADVFTVAWRRLDDVPDGASARPWLFTVARHHVHNRWRQSSREHAVQLRLVSDMSTSPAVAPVAAVEAGVEVDDALVRVLDALHRLNEADAEILRLAVWDELPHREIAEVMACSENAVAIRIHRARQRLTEQLDSTSAPTRPVTPRPTRPVTTRHEGDRHV